MSILSRWRDRRAEKRATLKLPSGWLVTALGGEKSASGVTVTADKALTYTAVYACVRVLSETLAMLPLKVYERDGASKAEARKHPLYRILHDMANPECTAFEYREFQMANLQLRGNAYAFIERMNAGPPIALWPLRADQVTVDVKAGKRTYIWRPTGGERVFGADEIHHIHGLSTDGITGRSPIRLMREAIGMGLAHEEFGSRWFSGGSNAGGVLKHTGNLSPEAQKRLVKSFEAATEGLLRSHKTMVLEEGMDWTKIGVDPKDAQYIEGRKFQVTEIARAFRVPPHLIGDLERATFTNIEHQGQEFVTYSMQPWLTRFEQAIARDLLTEAERERFFAEFSVTALLRGDSSARSDFYSRAIAAGWMSRNEARAFENLNAVEGLDEHLIPMNMATVDDDGNVVQPFNTIPGGPSGQAGAGQRSRPLRWGGSHEAGWVDTPELRAQVSAASRVALRPAFAEMFQDAVGRMVRAEQKAVARAARKHLQVRRRPEFDEWMRGFYGGEFVEQAQKNLEPVYRAYAEAIGPIAMSETGKDFLPEDFDDLPASSATAHAARHANSSQGQLVKALNDAPEGEDPVDPVEAIETELGTWDNRAERDGKRNGVEAGEALARAAFTGLGFALIWRTQGENCELCAAMEGRRVGGSAPFMRAGETLAPPGVAPLTVSGSITHAPLHEGCFPGNARVFAEGVSASSERWYDGYLVVIRTAAGEEVACTPNHPVLTDHGWVAAGELDERFRVVRCLPGDGDAAVVGHDHDVPTRIEEIAQSFTAPGEMLAAPMPCTAEDFHGDGRDGEITVVRANRLLLDERQSALFEQRGELAFRVRDSDLSLLASQGRPLKLVSRRDPSLGCAVCGANLRGALGGGLAAPGHYLGIASPTRFDAGLNEGPADGNSADAETVGDRVLTLPGEIAFDDVVGVEFKPFHGYVYNLQTRDGYYVADGIIVHNCDCLVVPGV